MMDDPHVQEVLAKAHAARAAGATVFFKWTCQGCGERATANEPNALHTRWLHEDCGVETQTVDGDLGFMLIIARGGDDAEV